MGVSTDLRAGRSTLWLNPDYVPAADAEAAAELRTALAEWHEIAPLLARLFPELGAAGRITSPLQALPANFGLPAGCLIKRDDALPVAGSVKARGGVFEVMRSALATARSEGLIGPQDSAVCLADHRDFFAKRRIAVGSTGNLGLSVGIAARALGYGCSVHMSADAKPWKVQRLTDLGVEVITHATDYSAAVAAARTMSADDPLCHFVDDEDSALLFRGYSAAAAELAEQLTVRGVSIGPQAPLFLYLPCGIGGAPGGIAYGARAVFGPDVHAFFVEPQQSASALCQMISGDTRVSLRDFGLSNRTEADGMAVASFSALVHRAMRHRLAGVATLGDADMLRWLARGAAAGLRLEPSATAGCAGPIHLTASATGRSFRVPTQNAVHVIWSTGGSFVPETAHQAYLAAAGALPPALDLPKEIA